MLKINCVICNCPVLKKDYKRHTASMKHQRNEQNKNLIDTNIELIKENEKLKKKPKSKKKL